MAARCALANECLDGEFVCSVKIDADLLLVRVLFNTPLGGALFEILAFGICRTFG